jgi:hypothetical protein
MFWAFCQIALSYNLNCKLSFLVGTYHRVPVLREKSIYSWGLSWTMSHWACCFCSNYAILLVSNSLCTGLDLCYGTKIPWNFKDNASWCRCWSQVTSSSFPFSTVHLTGSHTILQLLHATNFQTFHLCSSSFKQHCLRILTELLCASCSAVMSLFYLFKIATGGNHISPKKE